MICCAGADKGISDVVVVDVDGSVGVAGVVV
jgi:hypothetical protein